MHGSNRKFVLLLGGGFFLAATLGVPPAYAQLVGPKTPAELAITVTDSNPGSSREMGFAGGKIVAYSNIDTTGFTGFQWGFGPDGAKLSLDGAPNGSAGETLVFRDDLSNLPQGVAVWSGSSPIVNFTGTGTVNVEVETRLRLTVTTIGGGTPVPFDALGPRVDILGGFLTEFQVRFETLAQRNTLTYFDPTCTVGTDSEFPNFGPMLEVFDCATDALQDSLAFTSISTGFFVEQPGQAVDLAPVLAAQSIAEAKLDGIDSAGLGFIIEDWPLRWGGLNDQFASVRDQLNFLQSDVSNLPNIIAGQIPDPGDVLTAGQLAFLLGVPIGKPDGFPPFEDVRDSAVLYQLLDGIVDRADALEAKLDAVEGKLDDVSAALASVNKPTVIDVEVVLSKAQPVAPRGGAFASVDKAFLVLTSEGGRPVDADISSVLAIYDTNGIPATSELVWQITPLQPGLAQIVASLPSELASTTKFLIRVSRDSNGDLIEGSALVNVAAR